MRTILRRSQVALAASEGFQDPTRDTLTNSPCPITEAEVPHAKSASGHNSLDNNPASTSSVTASDVVSSLRDLRLSNEEPAPVYLDDTSAAHLD